MFFQARTLFQTITLFSGHVDLYSQKVILMFFLKEQMFYIMFLQIHAQYLRQRKDSLTLETMCLSSLTRICLEKGVRP